jgi:hypothetical protein
VGIPIAHGCEVSDLLFSSEHKARFIELRASGEMFALNMHDENLSTGPWHVDCRLSDSDAAGRLKARFRAAIKKVALAAGAPGRVNRIDWWISKLTRGKQVQRLDDLIQRSAEFCEELEANAFELGRTAAKSTELGLYRDRYPCDWGEPYFLYDGPRRLFSDPVAEFKYWSEHIWYGFKDKAVGDMAALSGPRERYPGEQRQAYRIRVKQRVEFRYAVMKKAMKGLSYDLAVLQANYVIDRGLRGDEAVREFRDASAELIDRVKTFWRQSSKRLGLSYHKQEQQVLDVAEPFGEVGSDLRLLTLEADPTASRLAAAQDPSPRVIADVATHGESPVVTTATGGKAAGDERRAADPSAVQSPGLAAFERLAGYVNQSIPPPVAPDVARALETDMRCLTPSIPPGVPLDVDPLDSSTGAVHKAFQALGPSEVALALEKLSGQYDDMFRPITNLTLEGPPALAACDRKPGAVIDLRCAAAVRRPRRTPDLRSSRARVGLVNTLACELATIKQDLNGFCTAESLKKKHPEFVLWEHVTDIEIQELVNGTAFTPKAWAENLTLRKFGLTSRETIKKDRRKLRKAENSESPA